MNKIKSILVRFSSLLTIPFIPIYKVYMKTKLIREVLYGNIIKYSIKRPLPPILLAVPPISIINGKKIIIGNRVLIGQHSVLSVWSSNGEIILSDDVVVGTSAHITAINRIEIRKGALLGKFVTITDHSHGNISYAETEILPIKRELYSKGPVIIGENVWIGDKVSILPNVTIGDNSIIGANSVVTKDIPPFTVACGNPAKIMKKLN